MVIHVLEDIHYLEQPVSQPMRLLLIILVRLAGLSLEQLAPQLMGQPLIIPVRLVGLSLERLVP